MVTFDTPAFLVMVVFLVPGFLIASFLLRRFQTEAISRFGKRSTLSRFSKFTSKTVTTIVFCVSLALLALAAAEPKLESKEDGNSRTLNAIIVMDISRSMLAEDGPEGQSRLETGILAVEKLLETYPDGYFGMVLYTNEVVVYRPTFDHLAIRTVLRDILDNYNVRGEGSTPVKALRDAGDLIEGISSVDTVILISDGGQSLDPSEYQPPLVPVLEKLRSLGAHIVSIGVGGFVPSPIPVYADDGELVGYHEYRGAIVYTSLEESLLRHFAEETSGWYLRLTDPNDPLAIVRAQGFDSQPAANPTVTSLVWLPVAISLLLVAFWLIITNFHPRSS